MTKSLLALILLPPLLMVSFSQQSLATGVMTFSGIIIFTQFMKNVKINTSKSYLATSAICGLWIFANPTSIENSIHVKQILSLVAILICGFAIASIFKSKSEKLQAAILITFWTLLIIGSFGVLDLFRIGNYLLLSRPFLPFSEPSHFAIAFTPIACAFTLLTSNRIRSLICLIIFILAISTPNLTLLIGAVLIAMVALSSRQAITFLVIACIIGVVSIAMGTSNLEYYANRISSSEEENISRLVYFQGWESMISAIQFSNGLGVGFQNLGIEPAGQSTILLDTLTGSQLNRADGSFLAAKIIGEFGVFGILGVIYVSVLSIRSGLQLRKNINYRVIDAPDIIYLCFMYTFLLELFVRTTGYFSPNLLINLFFISKVIKLLK